MVGSGSSFTILLITVERFIVLAYPLESRNWFSIRNNRVLISLVAGLGLLLGVPRFTSYFVGMNPVGNHFPSLEGVDYIIEASRLEQFWYGTLGGLHDLLDFVAPVPFVLIFNILVYYQVCFLFGIEM